MPKGRRPLVMEVAPETFLLMEGAAEWTILDPEPDSNSAFISRMAKGYATRIGARGALLSGGERQRIALARALFHFRSVLILDEAYEAQIYENVRSLARDRTVIVIAHRLSALRNADRIICLDRGKIVEQGTPAELATSAGYFARLVCRETENIKDLIALPAEDSDSAPDQSSLKARDG